MVRAVSRVILAFAGALLLVGNSRAQDPVLSLKPAVLNLSPVGSDGPLPIPPAKAIFNIFDAANNPVWGATVSIDMSDCIGLFPGPGAPSIGLACGATGAAGNVATGVTNPAGVVVFQLTGYAISPGGGAPGTVSGCGRVSVNGIPFPPINIAAPDQNGAGGVNPADASLFLADRDAMISPKNQARSDFNGNGTVNPADGSIMLLFVLAGPTASASATCP